MSEQPTLYRTESDNLLCVNCPIVAQLQERIAVLLGALNPAPPFKQPYHIETITQRLARLGVELAQLRSHQHDTPMEISDIIRLNERMDAVMGEILTISENWTPSNE